MTRLKTGSSWRPRTSTLANRLRKYRIEFVNQEVLRLRRAARALRKGDVDVLFLAESSAIHISPADSDRRRLPEMLASELGDMNVLTIRGPGYNPAVFAELVRLLGTLPQRPRAVVLSVCVRTSTSVHVTRHPAYGYELSLGRLRRMDSLGGWVRAVGPRQPLTEEMYSHFEALPVVSRWETQSTIGEYRARLKGAGKSPVEPETRRVLFDYFHGEVVEPGHPKLEDWGELARRLADYGVPVIAYRTPVPLGPGELGFPGEFAAHVRRNHRVVESSLQDAAGPWLTLVARDDLPDDAFVDPEDASEHLSQRGRHLVAADVARAVRLAIDLPQ